jgi:hypothetical protein
MILQNVSEKKEEKQLKKTAKTFIIAKWATQRSIEK